MGGVFVGSQRTTRTADVVYGRRKRGEEFGSRSKESVLQILIERKMIDYLSVPLLESKSGVESIFHPCVGIPW